MTVRNWISEGQLPAVRAGQRRVPIRRTDLEAFLNRSADEAVVRPPHRETIDERFAELQDQIKGLRARVELLERGRHR
jgi:excisionase family DNA binding protein